MSNSDPSTGQASVPGRRDVSASIRLTAAAVRLGEFGSADLAEAADANLETARAFVRRRKESGMLVEVLSPERTTDEVSKGTGRPRFRYRLADVERARAEVYLERVSGSLAELTAGDSDKHAEIFVMLEKTLDLLTGPRQLIPSSRQARLQEAKTYLEIACEEVDALTPVLSGPVAAALGQRLGTSKERLRALEPRPEDPTGVPSWRMRTDEFVKRFHGHWYGPVAETRSFRNFVFLLDGIPSQHNVSNLLIHYYSGASTLVAALDAARLGSNGWHELVNVFHSAEENAPGALVEIVTTLNTAEKEGQEMLQHLTDLPWNAVSVTNFAANQVTGPIAKVLSSHSRVLCLDVSGPAHQETWVGAGVAYFQGAEIMLRNLTDDTVSVQSQEVA